MRQSEKTVGRLGSSAQKEWAGVMCDDRLGGIGYVHLVGHESGSEVGSETEK